MKRPPPPSPLSPCTRPPGARAAFTLLEVLIALLIFTIGVTVLGQAYLNSLRALTQSADPIDVEDDIAFVRERILRLATRDELETGGQVETWKSGQINWEATLEETEIVDLFRVTIEYDIPEHDLTLSQTLLLHRPSLSEPDERDQLLEDKRQALERARGNPEWL